MVAHSPLVTILMPLYNKEKDVIIAIKSVVAQTFTNWELIIIDDVSTDTSCQQVIGFIQQNPHLRIRLLESEKNSGPYICMNRALQVAEGEYICRLDADDEITPRYLEYCVTILEECKSMMAVHSKLRFSENNTTKFGEITLFYRKSAIAEIGYYDSVRFAADTEFLERFIRAYPNAISRLDTVTYIAHYSPNSLVTSALTGNKQIRLTYYNNAMEWHRTTSRLYMPFPLNKRPFPADPIQLNR